MKKYILIVLWISPYFLNAQDLNPYNNIIPPNPDAASLAKYADFPVDLSSGVPEISIPLWNIKCGVINVPISLSYHASGIPVAETPSYVGLGWALNAGGVITRTIRGLADDGMEKHGYGGAYETTGLINGYDYTINPSASADVQNPGKYRDATVGLADLEPDMFYYNFGNFTGKFVFDFKGTPHLIPRKNIVIEKVQHSPPGHKRIIKWIITGDDGLKYYFEEYETTKNLIKTEVTLASMAPVNGVLSTNEYNSAWYLTKIELPNSTNAVVFEYQTITQENFVPVSETEKIVTYFHSESPGGQDYSQIAQNLGYVRDYYSVNANEVTRSTSTITGKRLSKIIAPDQTVEFISGAYRHDLKGDKVLDQVVIKNQKNEIIKQFSLFYNYFSSTGMIGLGTADPKADSRTDVRLSLESIYEDGLPPYTFEYENSVWLPDRLTSKAQDHWGYYNGADGNTSLLPYFNAVRDASATAMKAASLVKINYPTGGYTQFILESNSGGLYTGASLTVGGLRIKKKIDYDPVSKKSLFKQYDYNSSGYIGYWPIYDYYTDANGMYNGAVWTGHYHHYTSSSNSAVNNGEGGTISYEQVTIMEGDAAIGINGKTENQYTLLRSVNSSTVNNSNPTNKISVILGGGGPQFPFGNAISGAWGTGLLKSQSIYKSKGNGYVKIKEIQNTYKSDYWGPTDHYNSETDVLAAKTGAYSTGIHNDYGLETVAVQFYYIPSRNINLTKTIETDYDDNENPTTSKVTEIDYDNFSPNIYPSKTTQTLSDGNKLVQHTLYPQDYMNVGDDFIGLMKANHILNKPIENVSYKIKDSNTFITSGEIFTYKVGDNLGRPDKVFKLQAEAPIRISDFKLSNKTTTGDLSSTAGTTTSFSLAGIDSKYTSEPAITYDVFDNTGNLLQYHKEKDIYTTFVWGYNDQYPIAKIENATYSQVEAALSGYKIGVANTPYLVALKAGRYLETSESYKILNDADVRLLLGPLRTQLPKGLVTTYTYKPLVGMSSTTDFNGKTTFYEYDDVGRLKYIKDNDGSILKSYDYHYKEQ